MTAASSNRNGGKPVQELETVVIRFAGDSGDGMQLTGTQFTNQSAIAGNDIATLPDFPAEIRAPAGTLAGVSGFQLNFSSHRVFTPGDRPDVLVVMNPAALAVNLSDLVDGGVLIVDSDGFSKSNLRKAGYDQNPLDAPGMIERYRIFRIPITKLTAEALKDLQLPTKSVNRCKNFFALGLSSWLFSRPTDETRAWIRAKFRSAELIDANLRALNAGWAYGETTEAFAFRYTVPSAPIEPGRYTSMTGNKAVALGLMAATAKAQKQLFYASYPITPASDILHELSEHKEFGVITFQAEDEIAAAASALGASFAGALGVTGTSGPGVSLKLETIGLAVMVELPLVVVSVQRGGPSTGLPTKPEQSDLLQALFGRHGESPIAVIAPCSPTDCFDAAFEAVRVAIKYMTPVFILSDGFLANGSKPWKIPSFAELPAIPAKNWTRNVGFHPYLRDEDTLSRPWVIPGTPELEHRIGGLEKDYDSGNISYLAANHDRMVHVRATKIARIADDLEPARAMGSPDADVLVVGWGSTYGAIEAAVRDLADEGIPVAHAHLRWLSPLPPGLGELLARYRKIIVPELNLGQLVRLLRDRFLVDAIPINRVEGRPFKAGELAAEIRKHAAAVAGVAVGAGTAAVEAR
jgi:2-oxoglutarate ferredoxin oxidoreductase subunit alpha